MVRDLSHIINIIHTRTVNSISRKNTVLPVEKFPSPVLSRKTMLQHLFIYYTLYFLSRGGKFQNFALTWEQLIFWKTGKGKFRTFVVLGYNVTHNNLIVEVLKAFKVLTQIVTEILEIVELNIEK